MATSDRAEEDNDLTLYAGKLEIDVEKASIDKTYQLSDKENMNTAALEKTHSRRVL